MAKPPQYGLPHWIIANAPTLQTCDGGVYRATLALAFAYWRSNCQPLPSDDVTLASLCRLPVPTMRLHKTAVLQAISEISDDLAKAWKERHETYSNRARGMLYANGHRSATIRQQRAKQSSISNTIPLAPSREDTTHNTQTTHQTIPQPRERQNDATVSPGEIAPSVATAAPKQGRFTD